MSEVQRISYKTVSKAELGLSKSHMTHIGFAENTFDEWKKRISIKTKLNLFNKWTQNGPRRKVERNAQEQS